MGDKVPHNGEPYRKTVLKSLVPAGAESLLDVGSGPINPGYAYSECARSITCIDWNMKVFAEVGPHLRCIEGDFTAHDFGGERFDVVILGDVFEHIPVSKETAFVEKLVSLMKPGGCACISVPHAGDYAFLDPYQVKPRLQRALRKVGLYHNEFNGCCDVTKGHKHYTLDQLCSAFRPLVCEEVVYWGYLFDPLVNWADALRGKIGFAPFYGYLTSRHQKELTRRFGEKSYNLGVRFRLDARPDVVGRN
jgi:hypothetical protein